MGIQIEEAQRTPSRFKHKRSSSLISITLSEVEDKERILKTIIEKHEVICKGKAIKLTPSFSAGII